MKWWRQSELTRRVLIILILLLLVTSIGGGATIWYTSQFNDMLHKVTVEDMSSLQIARELNATLANQKGFVTYYFLDGDSKWLDQLAVYRQAFQKWLDQAYEINQGPEQIKRLDRIRQKYDGYIQTKNWVIELYKANNRKAGEELHWGARKQFFELNNLCNQYLQYNEQKIKQTRRLSQSRVHRIITSAVIFMVVSFILLIFLAFMMINQILTPIRRLSLKAPAEKEPAASGDEVKTLSKQVYGLIEDMDRASLELKQSKERLVSSEKMAMVGKLAAEVAHSIRNPMTSINMRLFSLQRNLDLTDVQKEDFGVVSEEMRRLDNIVRNFLEFSRSHKLKRQRLNIADVIDMTLNLLAHRLELNGVSVRWEKRENLPPIEADPELLKEVLMNLIINACEAMEHGGEITLAEEEALAENIGRAVVLRVTDNGPGMSEELQLRVLEPFETTKPDGTGLGLFIAVRIIREHGGTLELRSREGEGTTFIITLPAFDEEKK